MSIVVDNFNQYQNLLGKKIKEIRESKNLSQLDLAILCNWEKTSISRIENGRTNITLKSLTKLSNHLEQPIKDFFDFEIKTPNQ